jgi:cytidine kinase
MDVRFVLAGRLLRDTILPPTGRPLIDVPGGSLLYAASGLTVWEKGLGLLARVGEDYPHDWLKDFKQYGWDTRGVHILPQTIDQRYFQAVLNPKKIDLQNPVAHFARLGLPFPKSLLGYEPPTTPNDDWKTPPPDAPHPSDIPADYLEARAVHLCPLDYVTANRITSAYREVGTAVLTIDPSPTYMKPEALESVQTLLCGLTALLTSEEKLRSLFWGRTSDLWEMAAAVASSGCEFVVVRVGERGQYLYETKGGKRWEIPAYPARLADPTGAGDAFSGGFLAGYARTFDPVRAVLHGSVSASLSVEGSGALFAMEALPRLAETRLDSLAATVRQV